MGAKKRPRGAIFVSRYSDLLTDRHRGQYQAFSLGDPSYGYPQVGHSFFAVDLVGCAVAGPASAGNKATAKARGPTRIPRQNQVKALLFFPLAMIAAATAQNSQAITMNMMYSSL